MTADMNGTIRRVKLVSPVLILFLCSIPVFAQEKTAGREDFWICSGVDMAMYSVSGMAYGGGLGIGYGNGAAIGIKAAFFAGAEGVTTVELNLLLRWYFTGGGSGPFAQFSGGPVLLAEDMFPGFPSGVGTISTGLSVGWRFLAGKQWFVETAFRAGYPYFAGAGLSAGLRF
jgi:hypothetical protein